MKFGTQIIKFRVVAFNPFNKEVVFGLACLTCWIVISNLFTDQAVNELTCLTGQHLTDLLKVMAGPAPHTQIDADLAAGMGMPDNGPKLMSM
ncbi:hypothetical protein Hanom_Chr01g00087161 [Helianthus anomalus]